MGTRGRTKKGGGMIGREGKIKGEVKGEAPMGKEETGGIIG